ncbi:MAG TPA: carboxypeptidase-like regulatory domain-containing protein [Bryobacteraceae bacterium]|nr:carboxypeptidase-like regulatory domain-containing protein [Bryobacteraceae bacterium]
MNLGSALGLGRVVFARLCFAVGVCMLLNLNLTPASGQAATGTVTGQITDQQGAVIAGAQIHLVDTSTNTSFTAITNSAGRYTIANVPPAVYEFTVVKEGFSSSRITGQKVEIGEVLTLDTALQIGATATTVEVKAQVGAELQTLNATIGSTITNDSLNLLPNLGRDASSLSVLQVGVSPYGNVGGAATDQNGFQLDGGQNSDDMAGTNTTYTPGNGFSGTTSTGGTPTGVIPTPIESIEEFKVGTSLQTADFNGAAGSQVQMVTKRGTNGYHGALYEYYFGSNVGAANLWKNNHTLVKNGNGGFEATPLPSTHKNRFGGAFGGPLTPKFWGGKTYFFVNYEGTRFPNLATFERGTPTALTRLGVITLSGVTYNLNPNPVTYNGVTYQPAMCGGSLCDPRGLGINPLVQKIWSQMPLPNDTQYTSGTVVDGVNAQGYLGSVALPQTANFGVIRLDHDFGDKWKFMSSYRYYSFTQAVTAQTTLSPNGQYTSDAARPQKPSFLVAGLTTAITSNLTSDFRFSYLRNFWQWGTAAGPPQLPGLGGALEIGGESMNALIPTNVDSQDVRQRFWDGHDYFVNEGLSLLKGNHLFQFGGTYQHNFDYHGRNDNGVGIDTSVTYQLFGGAGIANSAYPTPAGLPSNQLTNYSNLYNEILGIVIQPQVMYSRTGANLMLNPVGTPGFDQSKIPSYDLYATDTWHLRKDLTVTYGLAWGLAMPPYEINGKQVQLVDDAGNPINIKSYLQTKASMALAGQTYNPQVGFETIRNVDPNQKYPFKPFYGGFSPRASVAWNPRFGNSLLDSVFGEGKTVIRGGYGRIYGRLNGVGLVLVPLLGTGLLQAVSCIGATSGGQCLGASGVNPSTAFRIGVDGNSAPLPNVSQTLSQPYFPGLNGNAAAGDGSVLDPNLKPNHSDEFNFTIQRSLSDKLILEVGYMGRKISNEFQEINIDAVPYMYTLNGQSFAQAYAQVYQEITTGASITTQPFFEAAMGGANSPYCVKFTSCTAAVAANEKANFATTQVYSLWLDLNKAPGWTLGRTLLAAPALGGNLSAQLSSLEFINSLGHGSYNAGFFSFTAKDWHGLTARNNFTWSKALGTGSVIQASSSVTVPNPYNFNNFGTYGVQPFDVKFVYSLLMLYQVPYYKSQQGWLGHILGGWSIAPLFTWRSGLPERINVGLDAQTFGEIYGGSNSGNYEEAAGAAPYTGGSSANYNVTSTGAGCIGAAGNPAASSCSKGGGSGINIFANPAAVFAEFRAPILGVDTNSGGAGVIRGFGFWNLDATISKDFRATEHIGGTLIIQFTNVLNHFEPQDPCTLGSTLGCTSSNLNLSNPTTFGVVTNQFVTPNGAMSRAVEFGLRLRF